MAVLGCGFLTLCLAVASYHINLQEESGFIQNCPDGPLFFCAYILSMFLSFSALTFFPCFPLFCTYILFVFPSFGVCFFGAYLLSFAFFLLSCRANIPASSVPEIECQVQETAQMIADSGVEAN